MLRNSSTLNKQQETFNRGQTRDIISSLEQNNQRTPIASQKMNQETFRSTSKTVSPFKVPETLRQTMSVINNSPEVTRKQKEAREQKFLSTIGHGFGVGNGYRLGMQHGISHPYNSDYYQSRKVKDEFYQTPRNTIFTQQGPVLNLKSDHRKRAKAYSVTRLGFY